MQLIRNQQVVCSSHITSSISSTKVGDFFVTNQKLLRNLPYGQCCIRSCVRVTSPAPYPPQRWGIFLLRIKNCFVICPMGNVASGRVFESHHQLQQSRIALCGPFIFVTNQKLLRNLPLRAMLQQVVCSSHIVSFISSTKVGDFFVTNQKLLRNLPYGQCCTGRVFESHRKLHILHKWVIFFADAKSDISLTGSDIARLRLAVIFYSP